MGKYKFAQENIERLGYELSHTGKKTNELEGPSQNREINAKKF